MSLPRIDVIESGFYECRLARGGVMVAVKVWFGAPPDPENPGQLLDRSPRWQALVDGELWDDVLRLWPFIAGRKITEQEYLFRISRSAHARKWDTGHPAADPKAPVDWLNSPPPTCERKP